MLPEEAGNREVSYLRLTENAAFEVPPGQSTTKAVEVVTRTEHNRSKWWSQPGVDLQPELQLVEGPLVIDKIDSEYMNKWFSLRNMLSQSL